MRHLPIPILIAFGLSALPVSAADEGFFFKPNDRIIFLGDSITEQYQYSTDMELYLTTRFPESKFLFLNAGIGGDTAFGGAARFKAQILEEKPTALTINFGMNDGGYGKFDENKNKVYREKTAAMLKMAKEAGIRVALCSPNAVDRRTNPGLKLYLETQKEFSAPLKGIAETGGAAFADQYTVTRALLETMERDDAKAAKVNPFPDGVHTSPSGGLLMAHAILTQLHAPAQVSSLAVDIGSDAKTVNCEFADLKMSPTEVSFTRTDKALPLPVQKDWLPILPYLKDLKDLNNYELVVLKLRDGSYDISIDGVKVATHTAKELGEGVNLGNVMVGPIYEHAQKVFTAINVKNNLVRSRFFDVHRVFLPKWVTDMDGFAAKKQSELDQRMQKIVEAQKKVHDLVQPKPHKWEVKPAKS